MNQSNREFTQPPWVYSPSEVMKWIDSVNPSIKKRDAVGDGSKKDYTENVEIRIDLNVERDKKILSFDKKNRGAF